MGEELIAALLGRLDAIYPSFDKLAVLYTETPLAVRPIARRHNLLQYKYPRNRTLELYTVRLPILFSSHHGSRR